MPQDAFTVNFIAKELNRALVGGKISKITQTGKELLTFIIYTRNGSVKLEICLSAKGCRINLTDAEVPAPKTATGFCMLLRKHLQNAEITKVGQIEDERIVFIDLDCTSEFERTKMTLYIELMGKYSNAVLVQKGIIVGALKTTAIGENTKRVLFTGVKYTLPEPQEKYSPRNMAQITHIFDGTAGDKVKIISDKIKGVSYATALEIVSTYGENLNANNVFDYLNDENIAPCVTFSGGQPNDFKVRSCSDEKRAYNTVLEAQTAYYALINAKNDFEEKVRKLSSALYSAVKKLEKRLAVMEQKLLECRDMETVKLKGELITANIYALSRGMDGFEAVNYYDENCGKIKIALDKSLTPAENAQKYYKKYAKLKRTAVSVTEQKLETVEKLDYLNSISSHIRLAENIFDLVETEEELKALSLIPDRDTGKKKIVKTTPYRAYMLGGIKILAGRSNVQNDRLLKDISGEDLWLHTQGYHSSHVAIKTGGKPVPNEVLKAAAEICAYFSEGRFGNKIPVDYTKRCFVKKPPKSNAGFVIYTDYKTVLVNPDAHEELRQEL
ncbi:MAG: NFACT family protein [Clostridia bacterium]|nr:NFACT family protein [Clostridia bacterium]